MEVTCLLTEVPRHRPLEAEDLKGLRRMICELMDHMKNFFYIQSVMELGAKFTGVDEFLYLLYDFPGDLVRVLNHYIYYSNKDLPLIEIYKIPPETFKKALAEVKDIQDLYNEDKLKELLTNRGNK